MRLADKRALMALAFDPAPEMKEQQTATMKRGTYHYTRTNYLASARTEGDLLVLTIYTNDGKPLYRTFQKPEELFSQFPEREKPSDATLHSAFSIYNATYHMTEEDTNLVRAWCKNNAPFSFFSTGINGVQILRDYQQKVRETALKRRRDKIRKQVDEVMKEIRPLPQAVMDWIRDDLMKEYRYFFYDYQKGKQVQKGTCSHCKQEVTIEGVKHRGIRECPHCHSRVICIANRKFKESVARMWDESAFSYIQPTRDGWCVRYFQVISLLWGKKNLRKDQHYTLQETGRYFYSRSQNGYTGFYEWQNFFQTGEYRFCKVEERFPHTCRIYPDTLDTIRRQDERLQYIPLAEITRQIKIDACRLIESCYKSPMQVEYFAKMGLWRMLEGTLSRYGHQMPEGRTPQEVFGLSGQPLKEILSINPSWSELDIYRKISAQQKVDLAVFQRLYARVTHPYRLPDIAQHLSLQKIENYLDKQEVLEGKRVPDIILGDWLDYLNACKKLGYDLSDDRILRPKDLTKAHDDATALAKEKENRRTAQRIEQAAQKWNGYAWQSDGLLIRPIRSYRELVTEGQKLKHCVANYAKSYADGSCKLFCIRKQFEPDTPYYTLELGKEDRLVQYRGYRNDAENNYQPQEEVRRFVTQWMKKIVEAKKDKKQHVKVTAA